MAAVAVFVALLVLLGLFGLFGGCSATDGSVLDATGCPVVFEGKCTCGNQTYKYWRSSEEVSRRQTP